MFVGGGVGRLGGRLRSTTVPAPAAFLPAYTTPLKTQASWWGYTVANGADGALFGGSTPNGRFVLLTISRTTGAILDARVLVDRPDLYGRPLDAEPKICNDHWYVIAWEIRTGPHAGKLVAWTCPHGPGTQDIGNRVMFQFYSIDRRTQTLQPIGTGADAYVLFSGTRNYGQIGEVEQTGGVLPQGTVLVLTGNDATQEWHLVTTPDPAAKAVERRAIYAMTGIPSGGGPQLYVLSCDFPGDTALALDFGILHPSVPLTQIGVASRNKQTGEVTSGGVTVGGCYVAAPAAALVSWGSMTKIHPALGAGIFQRSLSLCRYGDYAGRAILVGRGTFASVNQIGHRLLWCDTGTSPLSTWNDMAIGAATVEAQIWDADTNYCNDAQFVPPLPGQTIRLLRIVTLPDNSQRIEEWASTGLPSAIALSRVTEAQTHTRWMRLHVTPLGGSGFQAVVTGHIPGGYRKYFDFDFADIWTLTEGVAQVVTPPQMNGVGVAGLMRSARPAVVNCFPAPTRSVARWEQADNEAFTVNVATIAGMSGYDAVLPTGTLAKYHRIIELINGVEVASPAYGPIKATADLADIPNARYAIMRAQVGTPGYVLDAAPPTGRVQDWTSAVGTSLAVTQSDSARRPLSVTSPFNGARFDQTRNDRLDVNASSQIDEFFAGATAMLAIGDLQIDATPGNATNRPIWIWSTQSSTQARFSLSLTQSRALSASVRLSTETANTKVTTTTLALNTRYQVAHLANLSALPGVPVQNIYVDGSVVASTGTEPPSTKGATNASASQNVWFGNNNGFTGGLPAVLGDGVFVAKTSGALSAEEIAIAHAVHLAER